MQDLPEWLALLLYGGTPGGQAAAVAGEAATGAADLAGLLGGQSGDVAATLLQDWLDSAGRGRPPLPLLLAEADWAVVEAAVTSEPGGVPWLALPLAMSPQIIGGAPLGLALYLLACCRSSNSPLRIRVLSLSRKRCTLQKE